ncbi:adrenocorticotropic hormone receptor [Hemibagrus wyckioides]|uniref:adrenocorticotropic hormone receptor n=1 Tax=Hemibagrus wyckioides TaxID=337641 RepID=UPI00266BB7A0|nr:adrenocorticotropic hormone receptor [Hemibagrus wyckioides]
MTNNTTALAREHTDCREVQIPIEIFLIIGVVSLSENLLVVVAVIRNKNLHSPMYCFICSLAAFNTISSLSKTWENIMLVFRDTGHLNSQGPSELRIDNVMDTLLCMSFQGSIFSFLAIAVDRYITIFHTLRYHTLMTMQRTVSILITIWTLCGFSSALMIAFFEAAVVMIFFIVLFLAALFLTLLLYVHMFLLAQYHSGRIASMPGATGHRRKRGLRGALTLTILFGVFVVCWAPFFLHLLIIMVCPENPYCECYRSLFQLHVVLMMSHAVIDPAIYAFRSAELRNTFRKMFFCLTEAQNYVHGTCEFVISFA